MMISKASFVIVVFAVNCFLGFIPRNAADSQAELYWKAKLGNTPMPKVLKDSLQLGSNEGIVKLNANYKHNFANLDAQDGQKAHPTLDDLIDNQRKQYAHPRDKIQEPLEDLIDNQRKQYAHSSENLGAPLDDLIDNQRKQYAHPISDLDSLIDNQRKQYAHSSEENLQAPYLDDLIDNQRKQYAHPSDNLRALLQGQVVFFTVDSLFKAGTKMKLHFKNNGNETKFLPFHIAKTIPIASDKLQVILATLSVDPKSILARDIEKTLKECEEKGVKNEERYCATSLEAMVDYVTSSLNLVKNKFMVVSTEQDKDILMEYTILKAQKLGNDDTHNMVCHKMSNPYAVFLCHRIKSTDIYGVSLVGANGMQKKAVAVCHKDTSTWNPKHLSFQLLKLKPGGKPICHFISGEAIVWLRI